MSDTELIEISGEVLRETELAYHFSDGIRKVWLPKSQCQWSEDAGEMTMPEWLALKKELI
jgi:hypothetical protein